MSSATVVMGDFGIRYVMSLTLHFDRCECLTWLIKLVVQNGEIDEVYQ